MSIDPSILIKDFMVNKKCQVFTPDVYAEELLDSIDYNGKKILSKVFLENSAGEGHILTFAVKRYIQNAIKARLDLSLIKSGLEKNFFIFEIDKEVFRKCKYNLDALAIVFGLKDIKWNILNQDYLRYTKKIDADFIVGNPPYISYQEIDADERAFLKENFESCSQGKFDYCYAFIEKSLRDLNSGRGKMSYFIPSSIFKNVFGNNLRRIMMQNIVKVFDYKHRKVFTPALISPAVIVIDTSIVKPSFIYVDKDLNKEKEIIKSTLGKKWFFSDQYDEKEVKTKFGQYFDVSNSVATLLNDVFVLKKGKGVNNLEEDILREAASPRSKTYNKCEQIIFPYGYDNYGNLIRYSENEFEEKFPLTTAYLQNNIKRLKLRKADGKWFEYGRSQALAKVNQEKLLISSIITDVVKIYKLSKETIPYSGFFITKKSNYSLSVASSILKSDEFYNYIVDRAINANGQSVRISVNDIKDFGIDFYLEGKIES